MVRRFDVSGGAGAYKSSGCVGLRVSVGSALEVGSKFQYMCLKRWADVLDLETLVVECLLTLVCFLHCG